MEFWQIIPVSLVTALITSLVTVAVAERKLRRDFRLEFAAEDVARKLLSHPDWQLRSFRIISHHLGGFSEEDLRKVLVRAGAVRFRSSRGTELWGLLDRNKSRLGVQEIDEEPASPGGATPEAS